MTLTILPVTAALSLPLAQLHRAAFPDDPWDAGAIAAVLSIPGSFAHIACDGDVPAGFVFARDLGEECEILSIGVAPGRRGQGVARALLVAALAEARRHGLATAVLEVALDNKAARALYRRFGFRPVGRREGYYRRGGKCSVDALVLRACLESVPIST